MDLLWQFEIDNNCNSSKGLYFSTTLSYLFLITYNRNSSSRRGVSCVIVSGMRISLSSYMNHRTEVVEE